MSSIPLSIIEKIRVKMYEEVTLLCLSLESYDTMVTTLYCSNVAFFNLNFVSSFLLSDELCRKAMVCDLIDSKEEALVIRGRLSERDNLKGGTKSKFKFQSKSRGRIKMHIGFVVRNGHIKKDYQFRKSPSSSKDSNKENMTPK
jgi:hypothetical protein